MKWVKLFWMLLTPIQSWMFLSQFSILLILLWIPYENIAFLLLIYSCASLKLVVQPFFAVTYLSWVKLFKVPIKVISVACFITCLFKLSLDHMWQSVSSTFISIVFTFSQSWNHTWSTVSMFCLNAMGTLWFFVMMEHH